MDDKAPSPDAALVRMLAERIDRPITLVGMMGVGKTTVGRRLAGLLNCPFVDADIEIEKSAAMTIPEIFASHGEAYFRDGERRVIARLIADYPHLAIIATGGGAFCDPQTRALILEKTIAVWLDSDVATLVKRTRRKNNRPLLAKENPRKVIADLRRKRAPFYAKAHVHATSRDGPHMETVIEVLKRINAWL